MKKILLITFLATSIVACSNKNELATQLLNDKKTTEDSINLAHNYESYYMQQAKQSMHGSGDSIKWKTLADSSTFFYLRGRSLGERLKGINFGNHIQVGTKY